MAALRLSNASCWVGSERGSARPEPAANSFLLMCFNFSLCLEAEGVPAQDRKLLEAWNLKREAQAHLESHGVSCSQEDAQRQLGFVGAVAPEAMGASCHPQGCHQEAEIGCKRETHNTGCARGRLPLALLAGMQR